MRWKQVLAACVDSMGGMEETEFKALFVVFEPIFRGFVKYHIGIERYKGSRFESMSDGAGLEGLIAK